MELPEIGLAVNIHLDWFCSCSAFHLLILFSVQSQAFSGQSLLLQDLSLGELGAHINNKRSAVRLVFVTY